MTQMTQSVAALVLAAFFAVFGAAESAIAQDPGWRTYQNDLLGYRGQYPAVLFGPPTYSDNGTGVVFTSLDGAAELMFIGAAELVSDGPDAIATMLSREDDIGEVTYRRVAGDWLVLSGYMKQRAVDGSPLIFYQRVEFGGRGQAISGFRIIYPASQRATYDHLMARLGRSLTPPRSF